MPERGRWWSFKVREKSHMHLLSDGKQSSDAASTSKNLLHKEKNIRVIWQNLQEPLSPGEGK